MPRPPIKNFYKVKKERPPLSSFYKTPTDKEFKALSSIKKYFVLDKNNEPTFKESVKPKKATEKINLYKKMIGLYEKIIETKPQQVSKEVRKKEKLTIKEVVDLDKILQEIIKKIQVYERYLNQGGPGIIFHDSSLAGNGIPGSPLSVVNTGGGGNFTLLVPTGTVNGTNQIFVFTKAPSIVVVDQGRSMDRVSSDGTINWTIVGTTITLAIAPTFDIYGY